MKVQPLNTSEPEQYVDRPTLALMMGVSVRTIDRLVAEGMPSVTWGRRSRRFRPSAAIGWARAQDQRHDAPMTHSDGRAA